MSKPIMTLEAFGYEYVYMYGTAGVTTVDVLVAEVSPMLANIIPATEKRMGSIIQYSSNKSP